MRMDATSCDLDDRHRRIADILVNAPTAAAGRFVPPGCVGPIMALGVAGGNCTVDSTNGSVACTQPSVRLTVTPLTCNLPYRSGCKFTGVQFRKTVPLGPRAGGYLGPQPALYQVGWGADTSILLFQVRIEIRCAVLG